MELFAKPIGWAAAGWLLVATVLFCLPGSSLPSEGWMSVIQMDKLVHVGIFFLLCLLWGIALGLRSGDGLRRLLAAAVAYGIIIECVQYTFIPLRSFDLFDIVADTVGAVIGVLYLGYVKK